MANYFLFLDELKANDVYTNFCMGGIFVEEQHYRKNVVLEAFYHIGPVAEVSFCDKNKSARAVGRLCGFRSEKIAFRS